jgi:hypothetical protein
MFNIACCALGCIAKTMTNINMSAGFFDREKDSTVVGTG